MTEKELCKMCTEYSVAIKCEHIKDCKLLGILRENKQLKKALRNTSKELSDLELLREWERNPESMGR